MNTFENLERKIEQSHNLEFGNIFDQVIELFKKIYLKGFLILLITVVFAVAINVIFTLIGLTPQSDILTKAFDLDSFYKFWSLNIIYSIPQTILITTISTAFVAAFYKICKQTVLEEPLEDDYFYFFKKAYFSKLLTLGMISTGITAVAQLLFVLPAIYVFVPMSYIAVIFSNNPELTELEIIKLSFKLGNKKWFLTFGLIFICGILGALGAVLCVIGVLFTLSIVYLPAFFIYKEVIGFNTDSKI